MTRPARPNPLLRGLSCFACETPHDPGRWQGVCTKCGMPLRVDYTFTPGAVPLSSLKGSSLWRYRDVLPVVEGEVTLSEGWTPLIPVTDHVFIKDEARNPTGSFKARGMSAAVTMAKHFGAQRLSAPSAGNAAGALAAYGAAAGLPVTVAMPEDTPPIFIEECRFYGADVHLVKGTIADAGAYLRENGPKDAFDISTLREPYRIEGKKTMAYELFEQMGGELPDVIIYPTGGGTGLVGMWKAVQEMASLGWLKPGTAQPKLVSVQAEGCAPVVKGFVEGAEKTVPWPSPHTTAYGLRVPSPIGGFVCLRALRETHGAGVTVGEGAITDATRALARSTGIDVCPEGGAAWAALEQLRQKGFIGERDRVVVFNTGTGLKYR